MQNDKTKKFEYQLIFLLALIINIDQSGTFDKHDLNN